MDTRKNLHRARVARSMDLSRVSALTALSPAIVRKIDDGRYEELPGGLYARSYVRAFAEAVGIPPEQALAEVEDLLPGAPDPLPKLREKAGPALADRVKEYVSQLRRARPSGDGEPESRSTALAAAGERPPAVDDQCAAAILTRPALWAGRVARLGANAVLSRGLTPDRLLVRRAAAAVLDALVLTATGAAITTLTAWLCGVGFVSLLEQAGLALAAMLMLPVVIYFGVFQGIGGRTPGARACGLPRSETGKDLRVLMIATRAWKF